MYSMVTIVNNIVLHIWKLLREYISPQNKIFTLHGDERNYTYCGDHFIVSTNIKSYCTLEIHIMVYITHTSKKNAMIFKKITKNGLLKALHIDHTAKAKILRCKGYTLLITMSSSPWNIPWWTLLTYRRDY